jgi:hypothetical protein
MTIRVKDRYPHSNEGCNRVPHFIMLESQLQ